MKIRSIFQKILCFTVACLLLLALCSCNNTTANQKIREKYPLITDSLYALDTISFSFDELAKMSPHILEISVCEVLPDYTVNFSDPENNINSELTFHQYKAKVVNNISETTINTDENNCIIICCNSMFDNSYPILTEGQNAICSLEAAEGPHKGKYIFYNKGFYYLDDDTALSAYESDRGPAVDGCEKKTFIEKIKDIRGNKAK